MLVSKRSKDVGESIALMDSDRWTLSLSSEHTSYPVAKVKTDNLDDYARTWGQRLSHNRFFGYYNLGISNDWNFSLIGLLGINREAPRGGSIASSFITPNQVRLIIDNAPFTAHVPTISIATFALTNLTGTYDILNQPLNPPDEDLGYVYTPSALTAVSDSSDTAVTAQFSNGARPLRVGAGLQSIFVHVRDSVNVNTFPTVSATLRQLGSDVTTISVSAIEKTNYGYILRYDWNASLLPNLTDFVGLRLNGTSTGSSTPEYMSVEFRPEVSDTLYDTDWQDIEAPDKVIWTPDVDLTSADFYVIIQFSDLSIRSSISIPGAPAVPQYFYSPIFAEGLRIGRFVSSETAIFPLRSQNVGGFNLRKVSNNSNSLSSSYGGQFRAIRQDMIRWQADFTFTPQSESRLFAEITEIVDSVGFVFPLLYVPSEHLLGTNTQHKNAIWGIISSFECPDLGLLIGSDTSTDQLGSSEDNRFDIRMSVIEAKAHLVRRGE